MDESLVYRCIPALSAVSLATNVTSGSIDIRQFDNISVQPIATGSSILGSIQLMGSTDGVNFGNYGSPISLASGNLIPVDYTLVGFGFVQIVFTAASGVGTLTVNISGK